MTASVKHASSSVALCSESSSGSIDDKTPGETFVTDRARFCDQREAAQLEAASTRSALAAAQMLRTPFGSHWRRAAHSSDVVKEERTINLTHTV